MSHLVEIRTEVRDRGAVEAACRRLALPQPFEDRFQLYTQQVRGLGVQLPGWRYPVVCELASGRLRYDNFGGRWGEQAELARFLQGYAVEKSKLEARKQGHVVTEQPLADGSIKLVVSVAGGAA